MNRFPRRNSVTGGAGISLGLEAPSGITQLFVSPSITAAGDVVAADASGILLFRDSYGSAEDPLAIDRRHSSSSFLLYDAEFNTSYGLPIVPPDDFGIDDDIGTVGLVVVPGHFGRMDMMVAALAVSSTVDCDNGAVLRCFSVPATSTDKWIPKILRSPPTKFPWRSSHALSYQGRLWWVDPLQGLLACNPFADKPELHFVRLPNCFSLARGDEQSLRKGLNNDRCLNVSCGMLRLVVLTRRISSPMIKLWTLANPETGKWTLNDEVPLEQIWNDESYQTTRLPRTRPEIVLIHPSKSHVVHFCLQQHLFSVDLQTRMVIQSANCSSNWPYNLLAW